MVLYFLSDLFGGFDDGLLEVDVEGLQYVI